MFAPRPTRTRLRPALPTPTPGLGSSAPIGGGTESAVVNNPIHNDDTPTDPSLYAESPSKEKRNA